MRTLAKRLFNIYLTLWTDNLSTEWIFNEEPYIFLMYLKLIYVINLYRTAYKKMIQNYFEDYVNCSHRNDAKQTVGH